MGPNSSDLPKGALSDSNDTFQFLRWSRLGRILHVSPDWKVGCHANNETAKIFGNPSEKQTEDYVTGRFG